MHVQRIMLRLQISKLAMEGTGLHERGILRQFQDDTDLPGYRGGRHKGTLMA